MDDWIAVPEKAQPRRSVSQPPRATKGAMAAVLCFKRPEKYIALDRDEGAEGDRQEGDGGRGEGEVLRFVPPAHESKVRVRLRLGAFREKNAQFF